MDYVETPYPGYRLKDKYSKIISKLPNNGGRILRDKNGRPAGNILAAFYLGCGPKFGEACLHISQTNRYPGKFTYTTMDDQYDPHLEYEHMCQENRNN